MFLVCSNQDLKMQQLQLVTCLWWGVPVWCSGLRIWHCHCSWSGQCCGTVSILDPETPWPALWVQPKKIKNKKKSLLCLRSLLIYKFHPLHLCMYGHLPCKSLLKKLGHFLGTVFHNLHFANLLLHDINYPQQVLVLRSRSLIREFPSWPSRKESD